MSNRSVTTRSLVRERKARRRLAALNQNQKNGTCVDDGLVPQVSMEFQELNEHRSRNTNINNGNNHLFENSHESKKHFGSYSEPNGSLTTVRPYSEGNVYLTSNLNHLGSGSMRRKHVQYSKLDLSSTYFSSNKEDDSI